MQMATLTEDVFKKGTPLAKGLLLSGVPVQDLTDDELVACVAYLVHGCSVVKLNASLQPEQAFGPDVRLARHFIRAGE
jgi:hypothetical protein